MERRHDIDALRVLAFALVMLYHVGMYYVQGWPWHVKSPHAAQWLQVPMRLVNLWRMDLVFLVSGVALALIWRGSDRWQLLRGRSWRLLLPLAFGMAVVVPYQAYAQGVANGLVEPGLGAFLLRYLHGGPWPAGAFDGAHVGVTWNHLWFLPYLWLYTALLVLAAPVLDGRFGRRLREGFVGLRGAGLLWPVLPLMAGSALLWPHFPPTRDLVGDGWLHAVYFTMFLYGWWLGRDAGMWAELRRLRWRLAAAALALLALQLALRGVGAPPMGVRLAADLYLWTTILALLGWAHFALNRPWPWLAWANEQVYPWYVLHQTLIIAAAVWLSPLRLGPVLEPVAVLGLTVAGCWGLTAGIRRSRVLRPLFGLKARAPRRDPAAPEKNSSYA